MKKPRGKKKYNGPRPLLLQPFEPPFITRAKNRAIDFSGPSQKHFQARYSFNIKVLCKLEIKRILLLFDKFFSILIHLKKYVFL